MVIAHFILPNGEPYRKYLPCESVDEAKSFARHLRLTSDENLFKLEKVVHISEDYKYTEF